MNWLAYVIGGIALGTVIEAAFGKFLAEAGVNLNDTPTLIALAVAGIAAIFLAYLNEQEKS